MELVDTYFLSDSTGMLPTLEYAEDLADEGVMDAKDLYVRYYFYQLIYYSRLYK
jgi:hypothetical protein